MLFETENQLLVCGCLIFSSFALCILFAIFSKFFNKTKKKWMLVIFDFFKTLCFCAVFLAVNINLNYGETRVFSIVAFSFGFLLYFLARKLWQKLIKKKKES